MLIDTVLFYAFALLVLGGGILTITRRNAVHSAISLIVSLLGVAGLYLLQHAEFLFAVQIVLYVGGIMVLFLFVIMLVNLDQMAKERQFNRGMDGRRWRRWSRWGSRSATSFIADRTASSCAECAPPRRDRRAIPKCWPTCCSANICCRSKSLPCCCWSPWSARS